MNSAQQKRASRHVGRNQKWSDGSAEKAECRNALPKQALGNPAGPVTEWDEEYLMLENSWGACCLCVRVRMYVYCVDSHDGSL